jgi:putative hydrolase of the HAD superfamily
MLEWFDHFIFSDEIGVSKPARGMFDAAARAAGCDVTALVHVGDRPHNDIDGPHAVGARGVLLTVVKDRSSAKSKPDAVCDDYGKLPGIIAGLGAR